MSTARCGHIVYDVHTSPFALVEGGSTKNTQLYSSAEPSDFCWAETPDG